MGRDWLLADAAGRLTYSDLYAPATEAQNAPSAAVALGSVDDLRAIVRLANEHRIPLWPVSRGKNLGYGTAAPRLAGSVVLDRGRMRRIIEVNPDLGYCVIEPGVGFFDLYEHLQANDIPLMLSVPAMPGARSSATRWSAGSAARRWATNGSVLTHDVEAAWRIAQAVRTGAFGQNGMRADFSLPFGGFKRSGLGREGGIEGLNGYTERKTVLLDGLPSALGG